MRIAGASQVQHSKIIVEQKKITLTMLSPIWRPVYTQRNGIITGDNHYVSLADIAVHYILQPIVDVLRDAALSSDLSMT